MGRIGAWPDVARAGAARWRVFHSRRWLPADDVQDISLTKPNEVVAKTSGGLVRIKQQEISLDQKMAEIGDNIQKYLLPSGLSAIFI